MTHIQTLTLTGVALTQFHHGSSTNEELLRIPTFTLASGPYLIPWIERRDEALPALSDAESIDAPFANGQSIAATGPQGDGFNDPNPVEAVLIRQDGLWLKGKSAPTPAGAILSSSPGPGEYKIGTRYYLEEGLVHR